jgi:hypothetical protein
MILAMTFGYDPKSTSQQKQKQTNAIRSMGELPHGNNDQRGKAMSGGDKTLASYASDKGLALNYVGNICNAVTPSPKQPD